MTNKNISSSFFLLLIMLMLMGGVLIVSSMSSTSGRHYRDSYLTGIPDSSEIHYGTQKIFTEAIIPEEKWKWSPKDQAEHDDDSYCGHIFKWIYPSDQPKPYAAFAYENYSKRWNFATLQEAEEFVTRWCKP